MNQKASPLYRPTDIDCPACGVPAGEPCSRGLPSCDARKRAVRTRSDKLREQERPSVLGYELDRATLTPVRQSVDTTPSGDHGADPIGDGRFRMVPSGDVVDYAERCRRLARFAR